MKIPKLNNAIVFLCALILGSCADNSLQQLPIELSQNAKPTLPRAEPQNPVTVQPRDRKQKENDQFSSRTQINSLGFGGIDEASLPVARDSTNRQRIIRVFYATNRTLQATNSGRIFSSVSTTSTTYGFCDVSLPPDHRIGELETPTIWRLYVEDANKHIVVKEIWKTDEPYFNDLLSDHSRSSGRRLLLYVHGFANSFEDAARRTAQLKYDLGFQGPAVFFSWPSKGRLALSDYPADEDLSERSIAPLAAFIQNLTANKEIDEVIVIAHSMGGRLISKVLSQNAQTKDALANKKIRDIILAAPDIDRELFITDILPKIPAKSRLTVYSNSSDTALTLLSGSAHQNQRLGSSLVPLALNTSNLIDATSVDTSFSGHSYYGDNRTVLSDLFYLINENLPPDRRATLERVATNQGPLWKFRK